MTPAPDRAPTDSPDWLLDIQGERLVRDTVRFLLLIALPLTALSLFVSGEPWSSRWIILPNIAACALLAGYFLWRGRTLAAVRALLWGSLCVLSIQCALAGGIRAPAITAYPMLLMLTGWLLGRRAAWWMFAAVFAWGSLLALVDRYGLLPHATLSPIGYWNTTVLVAGISTLLAVHITSSYRKQHVHMQQAARELGERLVELQQTRDKFATLFALNPVPISITRVEDGRYHDVNPAWERASGWTRTEALGRTSVELGMWADLSERDAWRTRLIRDGACHQYPVRFRLRSGEERHFLTHSELVDYEGRRCVFAAFVDITERQHLAQTLQQLNGELEQRVDERTASLTQALASLRRAQEELVHSEKLASLGSLVAGIAHELNTPLGNAVLITSTLADSTRDFDEAYRRAALRKSSLETFVANTRKAIGLLEHSLRQARDLIQSFKQVAIDQTSERRREFAVDELVHDICETLRPSIRNAQWQLESELERGLTMDSFPGPLGQVLTNLVQNAFVHGLHPEKEGLVRITVRALPDDRVALQVSDDGCGIGAQDIGHIFDPFFTTRLGHGSSGLGLSIVYRLVTSLLGGQIAVDSTPGQGTLFTLTLPRRAPST